MKTIIATILLILTAGLAAAQDFNFSHIYDRAVNYTVSVNLVIEISFGVQTTEVKSRSIGSIVGADGLIMFDGSTIDSDDPFSVMAGMGVSAEPKSIEIITMDGTRYPAEYLGVDRYTKLGFCRIMSNGNINFEPVKFKKPGDLKVGQWLGLYLLLPEYVTPKIGADIGLVSAVIEEPEEFVLTMGFNELEIASVIYDYAGNPIGVLGNLDNPALSGFDASRMRESFSQLEDYIPLLGILDADRLNKLIVDPPKRGKIDRGWLGIYLQALTDDIAEFWGIDSGGGIIVNDVIDDSPADIAGIETGDIIVGLSGMPIEINKEENIPIFQKQISELGVDAEVDFTILRRQDGRLDTLETTVMLARAPISPAEAPDYEDTNFDIKVREMVFADYDLFNLDRHAIKGVVVKEVESGGWCAVGGIQPLDIILSIDGEKTESIELAQKAFRLVAEKKKTEVIFFVWRDNKNLFINVKTDW